MGASAGGFEALKTIAHGLPKGFEASIFIVWHMAPDIRGILPDVLNRAGPLRASHAYDGEPIQPGRIYIAPPDRHLVIEDGKVCITRGPKENRFRPAVDPLFRSAALEHNQKVIGVILSGALDDGTSGLWTIKNHGGIAVVQDPMDAEFSSMPENAIKAVSVDYVVPAQSVANLLVRLSKEEIPEIAEVGMQDKKEEEEKTGAEVRIAKQNGLPEINIMEFGELTPFTCPECHGVLTMLRDGDRQRFRCHTGHAFSTDSLLATISENIEEELWTAVRSVRESVMLLNHIGDHFAEVNQPRLAAVFFQKAREAEDRAQKVHEVVALHEQLSTEGVQQQLAAGEASPRGESANP